MRAVVAVFRAELEALRVVVVVLLAVLVEAVVFFFPAARFVALVFRVTDLVFAVVVEALAAFVLLRLARRVVVPFCCGFSSPAALRCGTITSW